MKTFIHRHFPKNKVTWKKYLKIFFPIIMSATIISLNGMIDNFMVGHINQGEAALGAVNSWTNIFTGLLLATSGAGSVALAQFFHAKRFDVVKQIVRIRFLINIVGAVLLFILVWTAKDFLINTFMSKPKHIKGMSDIEWHKAQINYGIAHENAVNYIQITSAQWLLMSISYEIGSQLREIGHGQVTMYSSILMLFFHVSLNSILLYGFHIGVTGPAIVGAMSRVIPIVLLFSYAIKKKLPNIVAPWSLFKFNKSSVMLIVKRYIYFLSLFTVTFFITFRTHFYDVGYPVSGNYLGTGVGGLAVLALTGAIMNVFTTTFAAAPAMAANFVGSELGKGNLAQAKINSDEIKGFNVTVAFCMSLLLVCFSLTVPHLKFLSEAQYDENGVLIFDNVAHLKQVSYSTLTVAFWYPVWIWFVTSYRNSQTGGKGGFMPFWDWMVSGPIQMGFLVLLVYVIIPNVPYFQYNFWITYYIFLSSDLLKMLGMEIFYYRYTWLQSLTKKGLEVEEAEIQGIVEVDAHTMEKNIKVKTSPKIKK